MEWEVLLLIYYVSSFFECVGLALDIHAILYNHLLYFVAKAEVHVRQSENRTRGNVSEMCAVCCFFFLNVMFDCWCLLVKLLLYECHWYLFKKFSRRRLVAMKRVPVAESFAATTFPVRLRLLWHSKWHLRISHRGGLIFYCFSLFASTNFLYSRPVACMKWPK